MAFTRPPVTAPDATFSAAGVTAWNAGYGVAGADVGGVTYCDTATSEKTSANFLYTETSGPRLQVGTTGANAGWIIGNYGSAQSAIYVSTVTPAATNFTLYGSSTTTQLNVPSGGTLYLTTGNTTKGLISDVAGSGLQLTAGTAASAVSALSLTQTWNYAAAAINAVDWTFTDTSSHASTNAFRIRGGAAGTTVLAALSKSGALTLAGGATFLTTNTALTDGAGAGAGTILNAPAAGNPTKWIGINDNGTTRYIPAW